MYFHSRDIQDPAALVINKRPSCFLDLLSHKLVRVVKELSGAIAWKGTEIDLVGGKASMRFASKSVIVRLRAETDLLSKMVHF